MIVTLDEIKAHLRVTFDTDDEIITSKVEVAEHFVQKYVGPFSDFTDGVPEPIKEAVRQLAAHYYENREPVLVGESMRNLPYGVFDLVGPWRKRSFGHG